MIIIKAERRSSSCPWECTLRASWSSSSICENIGCEDVLCCVAFKSERRGPFGPFFCSLEGKCNMRNSGYMTMMPSKCAPQGPRLRDCLNDHVLLLQLILVTGAMIRCVTTVAFQLLHDCLRNLSVYLVFQSSRLQGLSVLSKYAERMHRRGPLMHSFNVLCIPIFKASSFKVFSPLCCFKSSQFQPSDQPSQQ